jgi:hypothetical protein
MPSNNRSRDHFDKKTKDELALAVLENRVSFRAAQEKHKLQTYQLQSWIGAYALENWDKRPTASTTAERDPTQTIIPGELAADAEFQRMIGQWFLKNRGS